MVDESRKPSKKSDEPPASMAPGGMQYTLRGLLTLILVTSVWLSILFAAPDWLASTVLIALFITLPGVAAAAMMYGDTPIRAFCVGAFFPIAVLFAIGTCFCVVSVFDSWGGGLRSLARVLQDGADGLRVMAVCGLLLAAISGCVSLAVRHYLAGHH